ncbi:MULTISPECIES: pyridoxal phosphate-dependent aminotransferase [unclassified Chelatococcus]|uniref:pyridoxal phosphate-dependent aminotransferase n=1 Tax=unclassified Chelatococcus TaxID=2638111 RepID=UPI001BCF04A9|nr:MULTISPECIES: pyridoxal phosphate-dependent aminotransferase [unclassified Chelatococcus]MBS7700914.1 pyridoxal phosphate-dependent aminotransferase [Chelatococcus sp. YT9]MBX3555447.1 pyridoxal phosphate-dependent aminotransferase [Chelatococcus sp.]
MKRVAKRISGTSKKTFGMYEKALSYEGKDLIHLELGRPFADTPDHVKQATIKALLDGHVHYSDLRGLRDLRVALADKLHRHNGLDVSPENILVTNGLTHAAFVAFMALFEAGDEVILVEPYYPQHIGKIELTGAKVVVAQLDPAENYKLDPERIATQITERTRAVVIVNPVNPTGRVYTLEELRGLADLAIKHDLMVLADEVYDEIVYDGHRHVSIGALDGMQERTVSMYAFTKSFAMDGWRVGYLAAPSWLMPALLKITANDVTHVNTFIQYGAHAAVTGPREILEALVADDRRKRDLTVQRLNQIPGVTCRLPEGTIYAFPDISETGIPSQQLAEMILEQTHVVVEAGSFYGPSGEGHLRICFGSESLERIDEGMARLATFFNGL